MDSQAQQLNDRIQVQNDQVKQIVEALDRGRKWHTAAAIATSASALIAVGALLLSAWTYYESDKREADVAASEALLKHFDYAADRGLVLYGDPETNSSDPNYDTTAAHGLYTANTIIDLTEGTDERWAWNSTVQHGLLERYENYVDEHGLPCTELDGAFVELAERHFDTELC